MAGATRFQAVMQSSVSGPLNPALVDFTFPNPTVLTDAATVASVIAYMATAMNFCGEELTYIVGVNKQVLPGGPVLSQSWPTAEYNAIVAASVSGLYTPAMAAYGTTALGFTGATSSGRGDSLCVNTRAPSAGKHGKGRHFVPFLARGAVDTDGLITTGVATGIAVAYQKCFGGTGPAPLDVSSDPQVWSPSLGTAAPIVTVAPGQIPSRLRSRTK